MDNSLGNDEEDLKSIKNSLLNKDACAGIIYYFENIEIIENELIEEKSSLFNDLKDYYNNTFFSKEISKKDSIEIMDKNYKLSNETYFNFHTTDDGYDYTLYDSSGNLIDGGVLEDDLLKVNTESEILERISDFADIPELLNKNKVEISDEEMDLIKEKIKI